MARLIDDLMDVSRIDPDHLLGTQWALGDCNNKSVVMVIGKDRRIAYLNKSAMSPAEQAVVLTRIREQIKAAGGSAR